MDAVAETIATNRIREVRLQKGMSQTKLGRLVGLSEPTINRYEHGSRRPSRETMVKIASVLEVPLMDLYVDLANAGEG